jgi:hypothetical protein
MSFPRTSAMDIALQTELAILLLSSVRSHELKAGGVESVARVGQIAEMFMRE